MPKKTPKEGDKPKFTLEKRVPKEKPNFFQNIPSLKHPLAQIFDFPASTPPAENPPIGDLDIQIIQPEISKTISDGNPNILSLDSQTANLGNPNLTLTDSQINIIGYPNTEKTDSQTEIIGNPNENSLDSLIAKPANRISKEKPVLDSLIAKNETLDIQISQKTGKWEKYDKTRGRKGIFLRTDDELTKQFKQFCIKHEMDYAQGTELAWTKLDG